MGRAGLLRRAAPALAALLLGAGTLAAVTSVRSSGGGAIRPALIGARALEDSRIAPGPFPKVLVGATGEATALARPPARIVSTFIGADEILAALVDPARVVATSIFVDDAALSAAVGAFPRAARVSADPESILALRPDLVVMTSFSRVEAVRLLEGARLPVLRVPEVTSFAGVRAAVELIAAAVGVEREATALLADAERRLDAVAARVRERRRPRTLYYDPPAHTMGAGSLVDEIIWRAGGRNVAAEIGLRGPVLLSLEALIALQPEVVIMPAFPSNQGADGALLGDARWQRTPAARHGRVHRLPAAALTSVSLHAVEGVEAVARELHAEARGR